MEAFHDHFLLLTVALSAAAWGWLALSHFLVRGRRSKQAQPSCDDSFLSLQDM